MDLAARIEMLSEDVTRLGGESMLYASLAAKLTTELEALRSRVDGHDAQLTGLRDDVANIRALTREIRNQQDIFAGAAEKHVKQLHGGMEAQKQIMSNIASDVAAAVAASQSQIDAIKTLGKARKAFALAPTLIGFGLFLAGLIVGFFR